VIRVSMATTIAQIYGHVNANLHLTTRKSAPTFPLNRATPVASGGATLVLGATARWFPGPHRGECKS